MPDLARTSAHHHHHHHQYQHIPVSLSQPASTMSYYQQPRQVSAYYGDLSTTAAAPQMAMSSYDPYAVSAVSSMQIPTATMGGPVGGPLPAQHRASSGAWNQDDDRALLSLRAMGKNWNQIQREALKLERLSKEYMSMRKEIWKPLADRCGEKWHVVEAQCMSNGLKNIQSHARSYGRKERLANGQSSSGYDDDSGISGIGLTPIDDDDVDDYSSPEPSGSIHGGHSTSGGSTGSGGTPSHQAFAQSSYQSYGYQPHHGYSNSVSSTGTTGGYAHHGGSSQGTSPYMGHGNRLPSVGDMGINNIINRGSGRDAN
ncbi:hypothetical protein SMACR_06376 [Sordaria macrospora]|uniref:WGS project CABT00000000 data, contig 2.35 n=2 Tax=Sordaria macrospora TaxID=5147 RepID=F7W6L8_SORMK|nr:uncharacterized protein SMAC_06376 [Sordaria macrospora k-hell]KAA8629984.1 hypothetical protein SMACR_06376 [Sordaria macrospora]WPJ65691.1 hypothetical protein SMAC4_06376 [Sordaria macrospora]CCC13157.1 unnamed protein product [Sordaria macrospora k-hell]